MQILLALPDDLHTLDTTTLPCRMHLLINLSLLGNRELYRGLTFNVLHKVPQEQAYEKDFVLSGAS